MFSDKDECSDPSMCLNGVCQNYRGGYQCVCNPGFVVTEDMKLCVGRYSGYKYNFINYNQISVFNRSFFIHTWVLWVLFSFVDIDECAVNNSNCEEMCNNTLGSFVCDCRAGFALQPDGLTCGGETLER